MVGRARASQFQRAEDGNRVCPRKPEIDVAQGFIPAKERRTEDRSQKIRKQKLEPQNFRGRKTEAES